MSDSRILPGARARLVGADGVTTREFYDFFRRLEQAGAAEADIEALARKLGSPDGTIANIPPITSQQLSAQFPIQLGGGTAISLDQVIPSLSGELQGFATDSWGRVIGARPVVAGAGVTIDGTTDPDQIEISASGLANPMTTAGDIITGGVAGAPQRLGIGSNGRALRVVSGAPAWADVGDVVGPESAVTDSVVVFDGTTGKLIKDGAATIPQVRSIPQNSRSAAYTLTISDAGGHVFHPSADTTARTWTIPANASVAFPIGTAVTFVNQNAAGAITIAITTDTMRLAGAGTTGSRTLAANGIATALKVTSTEWIISGSGLT